MTRVCPPVVVVVTSPLPSAPVSPVVVIVMVTPVPPSGTSTLPVCAPTGTWSQSSLPVWQAPEVLAEAGAAIATATTGTLQAAPRVTARRPIRRAWSWSWTCGVICPPGHQKMRSIPQRRRPDPLPGFSPVQEPIGFYPGAWNNAPNSRHQRPTSGGFPNGDQPTSSAAWCPTNPAVATSTAVTTAQRPIRRASDCATTRTGQRTWAAPGPHQRLTTRHTPVTNRVVTVE